MTGFEAFWQAWPKSPRKGGKSECLKIWTRGYNETQAETIVAHVQYMKTTMDWLKDNGAFIPMPSTYLRQQRWDGAEIPKAREEVEIDRQGIYERQLAASIAAIRPRTDGACK